MSYWAASMGPVAPHACSWEGDRNCALPGPMALPMKSIPDEEFHAFLSALAWSPDLVPIENMTCPPRSEHYINYLYN